MSYLYTMLKLKSIPPPKRIPIYRANIHKTGRIGLAIDTAKQFNFTTDKSAELLINEEDKNDKSIYIILHAGNTEDRYKIMKNGEYHSINAKAFFDEMKIDYSKGDIPFEVSEIEVEGVKVLKFSRAERKRNNELF